VNVPRRVGVVPDVSFYPAQLSAVLLGGVEA